MNVTSTGYTYRLGITNCDWMTSRNSVPNKLYDEWVTNGRISFWPWFNEKFADQCTLRYEKNYINDLVVYRFNSPELLIAFLMEWCSAGYKNHFLG